MGLIISKAQDMLTVTMATLGLFHWLVLGEHSKRLRVTSATTVMRVDPATQGHDVPEEILAFRMKEFQEWFERDHVLEPERAPLLSREHLVQSQLSNRWSKIQVSHGKQTTVFGLQKHFSTTPLEELDRIALSVMLVRKTHVGRFLLCRIIAPCVRHVDVQLIIEDPEGDVYAMTICNFPTVAGESLAYLDMLLPVRLVMAIREPTIMKTHPNQPPYPVIRVDSPSDIVFLPSHSDFVRDINWKSDLSVERPVDAQSLIATLKSLGNQHFKAGRWLPAAIAYSRGIDISPAAHLLRLNRAEVYLRLGYYSAALADAEYILALPDLVDASRIKALYRAGKANYGRGDYVAAESKFKEFAIIAPGNMDALVGVSRAQARLKESLTGRYEWTHLFKESQESPHVDVADFVGPVKVTAIEGRGGGRGVVATRCIRIGEVLVVAKPFVSVYPEDLPSNEELRSFDLIAGKLMTKCQTALVTRVIEQIYGNPDLHDDVLSLYGGPASNPPLSYPPASRNDIQHVNPLIPVVDIDVTQIEAICTFNNFTPNSLKIGPHDTTVENPAALYLFPSLFNHACVSNAGWHCIGDAMVIRATKELAVGDEITISYTCSESYHQRRTALEVYLPLGCDCRLCEEDRKDGEEALQRREWLVSEFSKPRTDAVSSLERARSFAEETMATFKSLPTRGGLLPLMSNAHHMIAVSIQEVACDAHRQLWPTLFEDAIKEEIMAIESAGIVVIDKTIRGPVHKRTLPISTACLPTFTPHEHFVSIMISIAYSFNVLKDRRRVTRWIKAAAWVEKIAISADKEIFLLRHSVGLEHHGLYSIATEVL